ncbi:MAG: Sir2 silent information regulator family NAD-dependent deacetylase [Clostridia bacterium]|nr:Sir2 silent information regulator family NAD-dependent deacetylase [Clostridia bacterium]
MFGRRIPRSQDTPDGINKLKKALEESDAVIIGAGAGLSTSAGFTYTGERLEKYFSDFVGKYHFEDMYSGGFYAMRWPAEELWAYWSRYIYINRYMDPPKPVYGELFGLVKDKDYFVLTTNVDHCFQKAGFDKHRLFYTQGDYGLWQCSKPCHFKTYDNEETVRRMVLAQGFTIEEDGTLTVPEGAALKITVPTELVPRCPVCGEPMSMNLRADDTFVEDEGWHTASQRYSDFLRRHKDLKVLFLETAVGWNTPGIVKFAFWQMTNAWPDAVYACLNYNEAYAPDEIKEKSILINGDIGEILNKLK